jgi:Bacterial aa3 type cytochrome c oxidase subunit IV
MADHGAPKYSTASGNDHEQHEETYEDFLALTKWVVIAIVVILVFMFVFLT